MIHPTALIDPAATLDPSVEVGPYAVIDGPAVIGAGCVLHPFSRVTGRVTMGARNVLHSTCVLGGAPQDRKYHDEPTELIIGDDNIFREGVTVHRGTGPGTKTLLGSRIFMMCNSHVGHNCTVGDDATLVNGCLLAGHVQVGAKAIIGANTAIHQFCRVGAMAMISNTANMNVDFPPFFLTMTTNTVTQLNAVGLRRSGIPRENITALRELFRLVWRANRPFKEAFKTLSPALLAVPQVREVIDFCLTSKRGVATYRPWSGHDEPE